MSKRAPTFVTIPREVYLLYCYHWRISKPCLHPWETQRRLKSKDLIFIFKNYVYGAPLCGHVYTGISAFRGQKSLLDLLELELHAAASLSMLGNKFKSSARALCALSR